MISSRFTIGRLRGHGTDHTLEHPQTIKSILLWNFSSIGILALYFHYQYAAYVKSMEKSNVENERISIGAIIYIFISSLDVIIVGITRIWTKRARQTRLQRLAHNTLITFYVLVLLRIGKYTISIFRSYPVVWYHQSTAQYLLSISYLSVLILLDSKVIRKSLQISSVGVLSATFLGLLVYPIPEIYCSSRDIVYNLSDTIVTTSIASLFTVTAYEILLLIIVHYLSRRSPLEFHFQIYFIPLAVVGMAVSTLYVFAQTISNNLATVTAADICPTIQTGLTRSYNKKGDRQYCKMILCPITFVKADMITLLLLFVLLFYSLFGTGLCYERHVTSPTPSTPSIIFEYIRRLASSLGKEKRNEIPLGYRRVRWICSCGKTLTGDFDDTNSQALNRLNRKLQNVINGVTESNDTYPSANSSTQSAEKVVSPGRTPGVFNVTQSPNTGSPSSGPRPLLGSGVIAKAKKPDGDTKYFEVCVNVGEHKINLGEINISSITTDGQLFDEIWKTYRGLRGSTWRTTIRSWFLKPYDVSFVFFGVLRRHSVGIYRKPLDIPPKVEVDEGRYHYHECPMEVLPPIPGNIFLHYLDHAKQKTASKKNLPSYHNDSTFLDRLPKKLGHSILTKDPTTSNQSISYGWGIHIIGRTSSSALYLIVGIVAVISAAICLLTFTITWWVSDLDTAIGMGQYTGTVLGLLDAAIYCALQAYCTSLTLAKT